MVWKMTRFSLLQKILYENLHLTFWLCRFILYVIRLINLF
jgi:hypothetical protein